MGGRLRGKSPWSTSIHCWGGSHLTHIREGFASEKKNICSEYNTESRWRLRPLFYYKTVVNVPQGSDEAVTSQRCTVRSHPPPGVNRKKKKKVSWRLSSPICPRDSKTKQLAVTEHRIQTQIARRRIQICCETAWTQEWRRTTNRTRLSNKWDGEEGRESGR